jgi:anti-sigma factor RsiW
MVPKADEAQIVGYLLGELSEEDRTRLEERFLRDVEYRELIGAVEDDLIDDYVHGDLAAHERELFEKQFTSLPHRRQKVELAKALSRTLSERRHASSVESVSAARESTGFWASFLSSLQPPNWAFRYAVAAAVVLLVLGVWFITQTNRPRTELERSVAEQQAPQRPAESPSQPGETARTDPPSEPLQVSPPKQLAIATFVLAPGLTRESGESRTFVVPAGTQLVRLQLSLERGDEYPAYRAELRTASGDSVWRSGTVRPVTGPAGLSVVLDVSPDLLQSGKHELTLAGVNKEVVEAVGYYYFVVSK